MSTIEILVIEDEPSVQGLIEHALRREGYSVRVASDSREALDYLEGGGDPDLLIVDSGLPVMSGNELAKKIMDKMPGKRVLMISGYPEGKLAAGSHPKGLPFLQKPFKVGELVSAVKQMLNA